jgi:hypothetical protein
MRTQQAEEYSVHCISGRAALRMMTPPLVGSSALLIERIITSDFPRVRFYTFSGIQDLSHMNDVMYLS